MIERDHAPNAGTGLLGANFSRRNRQIPTDDRAGTGRWIAIDESGYHGDQLHGHDRYMILGSVAIEAPMLRRPTAFQNYLDRREIPRPKSWRSLGS